MTITKAIICMEGLAQNDHSINTHWYYWYLCETWISQTIFLKNGFCHWGKTPMNAVGLLEWPIPYSPTHDGKISVNKRRKFQVLFPLSTQIAYKPIVSFFLWWKVPAFSLCLCVCVCLSLTHTRTFKRFCVWLIFFCLRLWLLISTLLVMVFRVKFPDTV